MKLPKYNLAYNTQDQLQLLAINPSERRYNNIYGEILTLNIDELAG